MKKIFKYILTILLILPVIISATSFDNAVKLANDYYKNFDSFSLYFRTENNLPYEYDGSNKINSKFTSGGMLSKTEYDITVNGSKSYLFDGTKYWEIKGNIIDKTSSSVKTKVTEFTRNDVKVSGVGSFTNPWKFYDSYKVTIRSTGNGYIEQTGKLTYTKSVSAGSNIVFSIIGNNGYAYLSNDCGSYASYNEERNQLLISNVNKNISCSVSFGVSNYSYSLPTVKYTISNPNSGVRECTFSNAVPQTFYAQYRQGYFKDSSLSEHLGHVTPPYRRGWTFKGYYIGENQLINPSGDFTNDYTLISNLNTDITFKATENTYKATFDVTKHNVGSTTATLGTKNTNVTFDHDANNISIPSKPGYTFEGYYLEGKFTGSGASTKYFDKDGKGINPWNEDADTILYANWTANNYTLTYNANGGSVTPATKTITFDQKYGTLTKSTRPGYVFDGWYTQASGGSVVNENTIHKVNASGKADNVTIYAHYRECKAGYYCPGDNTEVACPIGTYRNATKGDSVNSCTKCVAGSYSAAGATSCTVCDLGKTSTTGSGSCSNCPNIDGTNSWNSVSWNTNNTISGNNLHA